MKKSTLAAMLALAAFALSAKTYYVKANGGSDANTGLKETAAFKTIQKAIDKAAAGSTILVYPGTYNVGDSNGKKVTIKSVDGPENTFIKPSSAATGWSYWGGDEYNNVIELGKWGTQRYYASGQWRTRSKERIGTSTKLEGFNLTGPIQCGTISHCVISGSDSLTFDDGNYWKGAIIGNANILDSRIERNSADDAITFCCNLTRCTIANNTIRYSIADQGTFNNCLIVANKITNSNVGMGAKTGYSVALYNTTIVNNLVSTSSARAAMIHNCNLYNCIVWGNRRSSSGGSRANFFTGTDEVTDEVVLSEFEPYSYETSGYYYDNKTGEEKYVPYTYTSAPKFVMVNCCIEDKAVKTSGSLKTQDWDWKKKKVVTKTVKYPVSKNNISADPCFIDPENGDFHLAPWSPCIDMGADYQSKTGKFDLDSAARKVGGKVDMGAYETQPRMAVPADYDGDGVTDAAFFFDASKQWWIFKSSNGKIRTVSLPEANGTPCPADYDGDGKAEPAYFTAAAKTPEFVRVSLDGVELERAAFGEKGATPVAAHLGGAGNAATFGTYTANAKKPAFSFLDNPLKVDLGAKASRPVVADFDADGKDDLGVYTATASKPAFSILQSTEIYATSALFNKGPVALGPKGAIPCCADYDGFGGADFGVYMSNTKEPYFQRLFSSSKFRETHTLSMGSQGDVPVVGVYEEGQPAAPAVWTGSVWTYVGSDWEDRDLVGE